MAVGWTPAPGHLSLGWEALGPIALFGVAAYVAFGADLPHRRTRFSRLV